MELAAQGSLRAIKHMYGLLCGILEQGDPEVPYFVDADEGLARLARIRLALRRRQLKVVEFGMDPTSRDALEAASEELAKEEAEKIVAVLVRVTGAERAFPRSCRRRGGRWRRR